MKRLTEYFRLGFKYALIFLVVSGVMGAIYGLFGLRFYGPVVFAISLTGIFVILNFPFALIAFLGNVLLMPFSKSSTVISRYFVYSLSFLIVFGVHFVIFKLLDLRPF
ncbi:MAG: hypothetical protein AAFP70_22075 [Calditrichota bacterium]